MNQEIFEQYRTYGNEPGQTPAQVKREALDTIRAVLLAAEHVGQLPEEGVSYGLPTLTGELDPAEDGKQELAAENLRLYGEVLDELFNDGPDKPYDLIRGKREFIESQQWHGKCFRVVNTELIGRSFSIALTEFSEINEQTGQPESYVPVLRIGGSPLVSEGLVHTTLQ